MEGRNVSWEDVSKKERELIEFEDDHRLEKKGFEARYREMSDRFWELRSLVDQETDKMSLVLTQFSASPDDVADYFSDIEDLMWQSEQAYKRHLAGLEGEEEEYNQLRRDYASTEQ